MSIEDQLKRLETRQEAIIAAINGLADITKTNQDMLAELMKWLQEPPSSELPDLIRALTAAIKDMQDQVRGHGSLIVKLGGRLGDLPAAVAQAVRSGEIV